MEVRESQKRRSEAIKVAKSQTLCWDCKHSTDTACPWVMEGEQVEGWWANEKKLRYKIDASASAPERWREEKTYCVMMCPLFERDSYRAGLFSTGVNDHSNIGDASQADMRRLVASILQQAVIDWERLERGHFKKCITPEGVTIKSVELVEFFNSRRFSAMLSAVSDLEPKTVRERLGVPNARCG